MSHISQGFAITSVECLRRAIEKCCPDLEVVEQQEFRNFLTEYPGVDYPWNGVYQVKFFLATGIQADLDKVIENPLPPVEFKRFTQSPSGEEMYLNMRKNVLGKDAEYVVRAKREVPNSQSMYEIGLVRNPLDSGSFVAVMDTYMQGKGLLALPGVGEHRIDPDSGDEHWAGGLKFGYMKEAAYDSINYLRKYNPEYANCSVREIQRENSIELEVTLA